MGLIWREAVEWGEGWCFSRYMGQSFPWWKAGWEAIPYASSRQMKVLSQLCSPGCCLKIQLRREPKFNEKSTRAASWVRNCSHGHTEFTGQSKRHAFAANVWEQETSWTGKKRGEKEMVGKRLAFRLRYHNLQEKGGELSLVLFWIDRTMFSSPDWSWEKRRDGAYETDVGDI